MKKCSEKCLNFTHWKERESKSRWPLVKELTTSPLKWRQRETVVWFIPDGDCFWLAETSYSNISFHRKNNSSSRNNNSSPRNNNSSIRNNNSSPRKNNSFPPYKNYFLQIVRAPARSYSEKEWHLGLGGTNRAYMGTFDLLAFNVILCSLCALEMFIYLFIYLFISFIYLYIYFGGVGIRLS